MTALDRDDRQLMIHNYRQVAEILSLFQRELRRAGMGRVVTAALVLRQFDSMTCEIRMLSITFISPPFNIDEEDE